MPRSWLLYAQDILNTIQQLEIISQNLPSIDAFKQDVRNLCAFERALEVNGEAVKKIPAEIKKGNPTIPWQSIAGMRDVLAHGYFGVSPEIIWRTVRNELPDLKIAIENIVNTSGEHF